MKSGIPRSLQNIEFHKNLKILQENKYANKDSNVFHSKDYIFVLPIYKCIKTETVMQTISQKCHALLTGNFFLFLETLLNKLESKNKQSTCLHAKHEIVFCLCFRIFLENKMKI